MKIGFIGMGMVGGATYHALTKLNPNISALDIKICDPPKGVNDDISDCDVVFISVPVPTLPNGDQDLLQVDLSVGKCNKFAHIFIRSTVLPGSVSCYRQGEFKNIYALPEFLTERTANEDAIKLPFVCTREAQKILRDLFVDKKFIIVNDDSEAEFVKYMHNAFAAVKVGFFNAMHSVAEAAEFDYTKCVEAACDVTGFIEKTHTKVPGPDGAKGFGGKCLPKDLLAFTKYIKQWTGRDTFMSQVVTENFYNRFGSLF